jgi:hypothetical protein
MCGQGIDVRFCASKGLLNGSVFGALSFRGRSAGRRSQLHPLLVHLLMVLADGDAAVRQGDLRGAAAALSVLAGGGKKVRFSKHAASWASAP